MRVLGVVVAVLAILWGVCSQESFAEPRWVIGAKTGGGAGTFGVEVEKEFGGGFSLTAATGIVISLFPFDSDMGLALGGRFYFGSQPSSRFFISTFVGLIANLYLDWESNYTSKLTVSFLELSGGFEWRLMRAMCIRIEGGVAIRLAGYGDLSLLLFGLTVGYVF